MREGKSLIEGALQRLHAALGQGHSDQMKTSLKAIRRFRRYGVGNVLLIAEQRSDTTHVAAFRT